MSSTLKEGKSASGLWETSGDNFKHASQASNKLVTPGTEN